jgi:hypothetical protein
MKLRKRRLKIGPRGGEAGVTSYRGISATYFHSVLRVILKILSSIETKDSKILDFGCGLGLLRAAASAEVAEKIVNFDIIPELSDVEDWRSIDFSVLVANQVFYSFSIESLEELALGLSKRHSLEYLVVGISRRGFLNKLGLFLLTGTTSYPLAKLTATEELQLLSKYFSVQSVHSVLCLTDVYLMKPVR